MTTLGKMILILLVCAAFIDTVLTCGAPTGSDILHQGSCSFTNGSTCGYRFSGHWRVHNGNFRYFFTDRIKDGHNSGDADHHYALLDIAQVNINTSYIMSPMIMPGSYCLSFWYQISGPFHHFNVTLHKAPRPMLVWKLSDQTKGRWIQVTADIMSSTPFKIEFQSQLEGFQTVAVDDIILGKQATTTSAPTITTTTPTTTTLMTKSRHKTPSAEKTTTSTTSRKPTPLWTTTIEKSSTSTTKRMPTTHWTITTDCSSLCNETLNVKAVTCDDKTMECKYTCNQGHGGDHCQYECDNNCLKCGSTLVDSNKVSCELCIANHYNFNTRCEKCYRCLKEPNSTESSCDQVDGTCLFGCEGNYCTPTCTSECSNFCINKTCDSGCCCTEGCKYDVLGGCRCDEPCSASCVGGTCFPDLSCKVCEVNHWGPKCESTCHDHCTDAVNTSISVCDRDGNCLFGCENSFWGNTCSINCSENCIGNDCNASTGNCVQGCIKTYWGDVCDNSCSTTCLEMDCYRHNGTCKLDCVNGYYGMNCSMKCPGNCLNGSCTRENGTCSLGCEGHFSGNRCEERKYSRTCLKGPFNKDNTK